MIIRIVVEAEACMTSVEVQRYLCDAMNRAFRNSLPLAYLVLVNVLLLLLLQNLKVLYSGQKKHRIDLHVVS